MASLANQTISSTYDGLIKTSTDQPVGVSGVQLLEDGVGNTLALSVGRANQGVTVTGTLTATTLTGTVSATSVLADGVTATTQSAGDNSTKVATTAYVDAQVTASDLDFAGDAGTGAVDLDSQTFTIAGTANEIETSASGQTITIGLPSSVTVGTLNATTLAGTLSTAAQPNITSVGTLSSLAVSGSSTSVITVNTTNASGSATIFQQSGSAVGWIGNGSSAVIGGSTSDFGINSQGNLFLAQGGFERLRIDSSGNVGINCTPSYKLDISASTAQIQNAGEASWIFRDTGFGNITIGHGAFSTGGGKFAIGGASASMVIDTASGNVTLRGNDLNLDNGTTLHRITNSNTDLLIRADYNNTSASSTIQFSVDGSEKVRIDSSGNLLVGLTSGGKFSVSYGGNDTHFGLGANYDNYITAGSSGTTIFRNGTTERMRIDSSGNVGIGTSSPTAPLTVSGATDLAWSASTSKLQISRSGSVARIQNYESGSVSPLALQWEGGNVGIGTSSPIYRLHTSGAGTERVLVESTNNESSGIFFRVLSGGTQVGNGTITTQNNGDMRFFTGTSSESEKMRITSGGFLKASNNGTYLNAAGSYHEFNNNVNSTASLVVRNTATLPAGQDIYFTASPNNTSQAFFYCEDGTQGKFVVWSNGDVDSRTNSYGGWSDVKLKENIVDATPKLDDLLKVKVKNYNFIGDDKKQIGVVAQELEEIFPSLINESPDFEQQEVVDEEGNVTTQRVDLGTTTKSVKYSVFVPMLIKAMQEQQEIINDLKARIETLENK